MSWFSSSAPLAAETNDAWLQAAEEGELSVDVFRNGSWLVVRSIVAGVAPEDLEVSIHGDLLTIRGERSTTDEVTDDDWFSRECFWGAFSRSVVLPLDVDASSAQSLLKHGVLEIRFPIRQTQNRYRLPIRDVE